MFKFFYKIYKKLYIKSEQKKEQKRLIDLANSILPKKKWCDLNTFELGIDISEDIIAKDIIPMIFNSGLMKKSGCRQYKGFDFVTFSGEKINVKSGIMLLDWRWIFVLRYFDFNCSKYLCIGYECNNDGYLFISHIWLIPGIDFDSRIVKSIGIRDDEKSLLEFSKYEISGLMC